MSRLSVPALVAVLLGGFVLFSGMTPAQAQDGSARQAVGMLQVGDVSPSVLRSARTSVSGPDRTGKDGPMAAVSLELAVLYHQHRAVGPAGIQSIREVGRSQGSAGAATQRLRGASRIVSPLSADGERVAVEAVATDGQAARLLQELRRLGLSDGAAAGNVVSGRLPISSIAKAADLSSLRGMVPAYARVYAGSVGSEADTAHATYQVRQNTGLDGSGQKVCALSDSYNQSTTTSTSASDDIQSGDLPGAGNPEGRTTPVDVLRDSNSPQSDEGRAMLQLIHDIAPGATLGFHTALSSPALFASGIRSLGDPTNGDCDIIVDDIRYNTEPFYQDGPIANAVDDVVNNDQVAYFSSAGNSGQNSYEAPFRTSSEPGVINTSSVAHDFDPTDAVDTRQRITIEAGGTFQIFSFQWTDPSAQTQGSAGPDTDVDIALVDQDGEIVAESSINNISDGRPFESLQYSNDSDSQMALDLVIELAAGPAPDEVKYVYSGSDFALQEYDTLGPTIYGHPAAEGAMAVAAAPFYYTEEYCSAARTPENCSAGNPPPYLESFSSKGGIPIYFDQSGTRFVTPRNREKPDVTGTDGIDNTFFGSDLPPTFANNVDLDPYPNFFGTSAAAPNVAAIAALVKQARPNFGPDQMYSRLEETAKDVVRRINRTSTLVSIASGPDPWSGHGFVQALDAVPEPVIAGLQANTVDAANGTIRLDWSVSGEEPIESYVLERKYFGDPFEEVARPDGPPVTLDSLGLGAFTFRVRWTRSDGTTGTSATVIDTLGIQGLATEVVAEDEEGRRTVELSWSVPRGTGNVTHRIERQAGDQGPFTNVGSTGQTTFQAERQVPGTYNYRITSVDDRGNALTSRSLRREIDFSENAFALGPYPNPVQGTASFDLTAQSAQSVTIEVYNTLGKRVYRTQRELDALTPVTLSVDASRWSSGMYFLRVIGDEFTKTRKMIVVQ